MMNTLRMTRPALLSAALCAALSGAGNAQASILIAGVPDWTAQNDARYFGVALMQPTLERVLEPFNYRMVSSATHFISQSAMETQLSGHGLSKTGRAFVDTQQIDTWYSGAQDRSVVCVSWADGGRYSQVAYVMPGRVRRADMVPLP